MKWIWQQQNWPKFVYDKNVIESQEREFIKITGVYEGASLLLDSDNKDTLIIDLLSSEAFKTSEIEGEYLNRSSLQSSIKRNFGLRADRKKISPAEEGISDLMTDLYTSYKLPLTNKILFNWHEMLMKGRNDLNNIGSYRTHKEPIQIISGLMHNPKVHYEAPPSDKIKAEMKQFIEFFNDTAPGKAQELPALLRASIIHLYFESVHPFEDGNGRIGRALVIKALSQSFDQPMLIALSEIIQKSKKLYYNALSYNSKSLNINKWITYFGKVILDAQEYSIGIIKFIISKSHFFERLNDKINNRQEKALLRMFEEGPEGFAGGLSAENYIRITKASRATATRDLQSLVNLGALKKTGTLKHTRYYLKLK